MRYDEGYRFLADPSKRIDLWDCVKYIRLDGAGFLSLGGEIRLRFEGYENDSFNSNPKADSDSFLQRYLFHADYHPTEWLRIFGQLQSSLENGRPEPTGPPDFAGRRPTDRDTIDIHQLFTDLVTTTGADERLTLRLGRQEMSYGSGRLIGPREGPNNRRAYDAVRFLYERDDLSVDGFFSSPVEVDTEGFDDQNVNDVWFWGVYATMPFHPLRGMRLDLYYLGLSNPHDVFSQGAGREQRQTVGLRFFGNLGRWDINDEAIYQFGRFRSGDISAWFVATDQGYTLADLWAKPRLGLRVSGASGDSSGNDADLQTFNALFAPGNYFTEAGLLSPQNFFNIYPNIRITPFPRWTAELAVDFHWRENLGDGIYRPGGSVIYKGDKDFGRFIGTEIYFATGWQVTPHLGLYGAYSHFFAGQFIHQNLGRDVDFVGLWTIYKF